jgi:hypothetical protein
MPKRVVITTMCLRAQHLPRVTRDRHRRDGDGPRWAAMCRARRQTSRPSASRRCRGPVGMPRWIPCHDDADCGAWRRAVKVGPSACASRTAGAAPLTTRRHARDRNDVGQGRAWPRSKGVPAGGKSDRCRPQGPAEEPPARRVEGTARQLLRRLPATVARSRRREQPLHAKPLLCSEVSKRERRDSNPRPPA